MRGAGGSSGGIGHFFLGLAMLVIGVYLLLQSITVSSNFGMGYSLYHYGGYRLTTGVILVPFCIGVAMVFYNAKSIVGWLLSVGSLALLIVGVIASIQFRFQTMSAFDLILILVLTLGGLGLFLRSLKAS